MIIDSFGTHLDVELQQRGIEFSQLFKAYNHLRPGLLEKMPPMQVTARQQNGATAAGGAEEGVSSADLLENGQEEEGGVVALGVGSGSMADNSVSGRDEIIFLYEIIIHFVFNLSECSFGFVGRITGAHDDDDDIGCEQRQWWWHWTDTCSHR